MAEKPYLVIVESPGKIKKLKSILGSDYEVIASMGHVLDLPAKSFGIDLATMKADYVVTKSDVAKRLQTEAQKPYKIIYLASDPDREGEAISHHVANLLKRAKTKASLQRVTFDAITPTAVKNAFANPRSLDSHLVEAQEARRLLDRLVGFPASRFLWQFVQGTGLSAGRVQSVALRLVVEREEAIRNFVPEEYWTISALFRAKEGQFTALLKQWQGKKPALKRQADAEAVISALNGVSFQIGTVTPKQRQQKPPAPFTTSTFQQAASSHLKMSPDLSMKLAQTLYENGLITYMRTDSPSVSPEGQQMAKATLLNLFGERYLGSQQYRAKGNAQEAHECIRPTDTDASPDSLRSKFDPKIVSVYGLIYKRFLASQMANAIFDEVHVTVLGGAAVFAAKGSRLAFDGFLRVYGYSEEQETAKRADDEDDDTPSNQQLPPLIAGEAVTALKLIPKQHFTQPPSPYTEALLVKALEKAGVGRPSTYAQIIGILKKRHYVTLEQRKLAPTDLGKNVAQVLVEKLPRLFEVGFTAQMETALDNIAAGQQNSQVYLKTFWAEVAPLLGEKVIQQTVTAESKQRTTKPKTKRATSKPPAPIDPALGACPQCGKALVQRESKHGKFIGCSGYPKCRYTGKLK